MSETLKQIMAERDLSRAITALYLEVDESIVNDIRSKVDAAFQSVRDERDRLQRLINIYAKAKVVFDEGRLREDHHAWKERYQALVSAEDELKAALTPARGGKNEK